MCATLAKMVGLMVVVMTMSMTPKAYGTQINRFYLLVHLVCQSLSVCVAYVKRYACWNPCSRDRGGKNIIAHKRQMLYAYIRMCLFVHGRSRFSLVVCDGPMLT